MVWAIIAVCQSSAAEGGSAFWMSATSRAAVPSRAGSGRRFHPAGAGRVRQTLGAMARGESPSPTRGSRRMACGELARREVFVRAGFDSSAPSLSRECSSLRSRR